MNLIFENQSKHKVSKRLFTEIIKRLHREVPDVYEDEVELLLTTNSGIQKLNKDYRGIDKATDVLSFSDRDIEGARGENTCLGQIIISVERAESQAHELNQTVVDELKFLFTHGLLHLLGYDHETPKTKN
jgi:probable rRNA maturation factor